MPGSAGTPSRLFGPALLTNAAATKYTVPAGTNALIRHVHLSNEDTSVRTVTISVGLDAAGTEVFTTFQVQPGSTYDWYPYLPMAAAEVIQALADVGAKVNMVVAGDQWLTG